MAYKKMFLVGLYIIQFIFSETHGEKALVVVPIADLVGQSMNNTYKLDNSMEKYKKIPLEGQRGSLACPRVHQLIFNEIIDILETNNNEVKININNVFYITNNGKPEPKRTFWGQKKDFVTFGELKKNKIDISLIPTPIQFCDNSANKTNKKNIVTLKFPFCDKKTKQKFSAGTRFTIKNLTSVDYYTAFVFNKKIFTFDEITIPKQLCMLNSPKNSSHARNNFTSLISQWSHRTDGFIPYVWGGCSFIQTCPKNLIKKKMIEDEKGRVSIVFSRNNYKHDPSPGLDCSGLVWRAAQICNIPYFYKNTVTIDHYLKSINSIENIENGDLILYKGHVMIISDVKNNKVIEASTHDYGWGKIHEIPLHKAFQNIHTYKELFNNMKNQKILYRIDRKGKITREIKNFRLLKLFTT